MATLVRGLRGGLSIHASQSAEDPITLVPTNTPLLFCQTSGTGGAPKVVRRRPGSWRHSFEVNRAEFSLGKTERYAMFGHIGHSLTLYATLEALHLGADLALLGDMTPKRQVRAVVALGISVIYATPTQMRLFTRAQRAAGITILDRLRRVFVGGGKLDALLRAQIQACFPDAEIREFYGASETSFIAIGDADTPEGAVGRAYPGVQLRLDARSGEIWVSSPYLFDGYENGHSPDTRRDGKWLSIGELGRFGPDGHLFVDGRKSRMVLVADKNVFPERIEQVVAAMPDVAACAVLARPDPLRGHRLICFVLGPVDAPALRRACRAALPPEAVPYRFVQLHNMPLLPAGKPDLQALQSRLEFLP